MSATSHELDRTDDFCHSHGCHNGMIISGDTAGNVKVWKIEHRAPKADDARPSPNPKQAEPLPEVAALGFSLYRFHDALHPRGPVSPRSRAKAAEDVDAMVRSSLNFLASSFRACALFLPSSCVRARARTAYTRKERKTTQTQCRSDGVVFYVCGEVVKREGWLQGGGGCGGCGPGGLRCLPATEPPCSASFVSASCGGFPAKTRATGGRVDQPDRPARGAQAVCPQDRLPARRRRVWLF